MYHKHPSFSEPPNLNIKLWRYLDFTKFVSLIDKRALFFISADKLEDVFEGATTKVNLKLRKKFAKDYNLPKRTIKSRSILRKHIFINSWHMNEYESTAMWKLYLISEEGVAIQTTFKNLTKSFKKCREYDIFAGMVKYTDYENEIIPEGNIFNPFMHKRKSFEHEKEVRAVILNISTKNKSLETGLYVKVDLDLLINKVYISPYSKKWLHELVQSVAKKYGLKANVVKSSLSESPIFLF